MSLLGPSEEQLGAVRNLHPLLGEVAEACTAPDADARPTFAEVVTTLNRVQVAALRSDEGDGDTPRRSSKRHNQVPPACGCGWLGGWEGRDSSLLQGRGPRKAACGRC